MTEEESTTVALCWVLPFLQLTGIDPRNVATFERAGVSLADFAKPDRIITVSEERTVDACLSFVRDHHLLVGGSTGSVLSAVQEMAPEFRRGDTIVAISADLGDKYLDTIYDPAWVSKVITPNDETRASVAAE